MKKLAKIVLTFIIVLIAVSCLKDQYEIEYQDGYPNKLAGNWVAFEFRGGSIEGEILEPYDLVTSLDPNVQGSLIFDKLYDSDIRVRTEYADSTFFVEMGEQLELISENTYEIGYISIDGYITSNPVLIDLVYRLATTYYEGDMFEESDIEDIIYLHAGYYDDYESLIDTVMLIGYRKTGFEEVLY